MTRVDRLRFNCHKLLLAVIWVMVYPLPALGYLYGKVMLGHELPSQTLLCLQAGVRGWKNIEFVELERSATEYLTSSAVIKQKINEESSFLRQTSRLLENRDITHFFYDPRSNDVGFWRGVCEAILLAVLFGLRGVTPIVYLTDFAIFRHRTQASIVTAARGVVLCFAKTSELDGAIPHSRTIGPSIMPFSIESAQVLCSEVSDRGRDSVSVAFFGSLYEPRITLLESIHQGLSRHGIEFEISGRGSGGPRVSNEVYWQRLLLADIIVTTTSQITEPGRDLYWVPQLVYRCTEALVCDSALVIQDVPGIEDWFEPGKDLVTFETAEEAVEIILNLTSDSVYRASLRRSGREKAMEIIRHKRFWESVNLGLGKNNLRARAVT